MRGVGIMMLAMVATGCGQGADQKIIGSVRAGENVDLSLFVTVNLVLFEDKDPSFDPRIARRYAPDDQWSNVDARLADIDRSGQEFVIEIPGKSDVQPQAEWRMNVWVSKRDLFEGAETSTTSAPFITARSGEFYGTTTYVLPDPCEGGGWCGTVEGVDVTIDTPIP